MNTINVIDGLVSTLSSQRDALLKTALAVTQAKTQKRRAKAEIDLKVVLAYCVAYDKKNPIVRLITKGAQRRWKARVTRSKKSRKKHFDTFRRA